jgi:hypothetical protein
MATYNTPYRQARKNVVKPLVTPALDAIVSHAFVTNYLADRLPLEYDTPRQFRDRIGKKVKRARDAGTLQSTNGRYQFGHFAAWARSRDDFADAVSDIALPNTGSVNAILPGMFGQASGYSLPITLEDCKAALVVAYRELNQLRGDNQSLRDAVAALTPYKEKAIARSLASSIAGKKGKRSPQR